MAMGHWSSVVGHLSQTRRVVGLWWLVVGNRYSLRDLLRFIHASLAKSVERFAGDTNDKI
jgi:hypothetical protein